MNFDINPTISSDTCILCATKFDQAITTCPICSVSQPEACLFSCDTHGPFNGDFLQIKSRKCPVSTCKQALKRKCIVCTKVVTSSNFTKHLCVPKMAQQSVMVQIEVLTSVEIRNRVPTVLTLALVSRQDPGKVLTVPVRALVKIGTGKMSISDVQFSADKVHMMTCVQNNSNKQQLEHASICLCNSDTLEVISNSIDLLFKN